MRFVPVVHDEGPGPYSICIPVFTVPPTTDTIDL